MYSKILIIPPLTENQIFSFGFCKLEVPHWKILAQLTPSDLKTKLMRRRVLKKVNTEWQEKKIQILLYGENYT